MACQRERETIIGLVESNVPYIDHIPIWAAFFINFINISATFVWNFMDIFIIVISIGLSTNFELINKELESANIDVSPELLKEMEILCLLKCVQFMTHEMLDI